MDEESNTNNVENTSASFDNSPPYAEVTPERNELAEETTTVAEEEPVVEEPVAEEPVAEEPAVEESPNEAVVEETTTKGKPVRSEKQKEADAGQKKMLDRLRQLYNEEFADLPERKRPKAKAWVARAAYYKPTEEEREEYIAEMIKADRDAVNGVKVEKSNSSGKSSMRSMVYEFNNALDDAVQDATASVEDAAKTSSTRRAAKRFVSVLSKSTRKLKTSLMRVMGSNNSGANNGASTNENSPYKVRNRNRNVPVSNNSAMIRENSLNKNNSGSAMNNSLNRPEPTTTEAENSSLNLNMSKINLNSNKNVNNGANNGANNRSYNRLMNTVKKTRKRGRRNENENNYNSNYRSRNNSSGYNTNYSQKNKKRSKMASEYTEL